MFAALMRLLRRTELASAPPAELRQAVIGYMQQASMEITPAEYHKLGGLSGLLKPGTPVFITCLPNSALATQLETAQGLSREGLVPVPHIPCRRFASLNALREHVSALAQQAGVKRILLIAGAQTTPAGEIDSSLAVLDAAGLDGLGLELIYVAGHPEGNPDISAPVLQEALARKNVFAHQQRAELALVTQFGFTPQPLLDWAAAIAQQGNRLPIHPGIPGLTNVKQLMRFAKVCGVESSAKVLRQRKGKLSRLATGWSPDRMVAAYALSWQRNERHISTPHFYSLGAPQQTARWIAQVAAGEFELTAQGFRLL